MSRRPAESKLNGSIWSTKRPIISVRQSLKRELPGEDIQLHTSSASKNLNVYNRGLHIKLMVWKYVVFSVVVLAVQPTSLKIQGAKPLLRVPFHHIKALSPASIARADLLKKFSHTDNSSLSIL